MVDEAIVVRLGNSEVGACLVNLRLNLLDVGGLRPGEQGSEVVLRLGERRLRRGDVGLGTRNRLPRRRNDVGVAPASRASSLAWALGKIRRAWSRESIAERLSSEAIGCPCWT